MERILIGAITGLLISTSLYVWNSKNFTKEQRILLLICIVFPPAQWIGIIIILIYNNYKLENTPEKLSEKKVIEKKIELNTTIDNLLELKEKGILTSDEYYEKVDKIESQKIEVQIKNSSEYKQLKNLFENNILTADEFENKIKLLKTEKIFKSIVKRNELENSDTLLTVYRETTDNKTLKIISEYNQTIGADVFINDLPAPDGIYIYKAINFKLIIKNGKIEKRFYLEKFKNYIFEKSNSYAPTTGDKVYNLNWTKAQNGKIQYSIFNNLTIEDGIIVKKIKTTANTC
jgi:hypothetical protein